MNKSLVLNPWLLSSPPASPNPWSNAIHFKEDRTRVFVYPTVNATYDPATQLLTYELSGVETSQRVSQEELRTIALPSPNSVVLTQEQADQLRPTDTIFLVDLNKIPTTEEEPGSLPRLHLS